MKNKFYKSLGLIEINKKAIDCLAIQLEIPLERLKYYNNKNILPSKSDLIKISNKLGIIKEQIMLGMGIVDYKILKFLSDNASLILKNYIPETSLNNVSLPVKTFETNLGKLYQGDCISLMKNMEDESVELVFADPPFNLNKIYASDMDDNLTSEEYIKWSEEWINECIRILKPGGSFFLWNLPKWNTYFSRYLNDRLSFRNWISTDMKFSLPIKGKLYPSHYSLLYYVKGDKPSYFNPDRLPMELCKNCYKEIKDYGGYKDKMNPLGINITDVWLDIPPVRHAKYKKRKEANELSIRLLDRIIEMSSKPGDTIFDPFGGSGSSYIVAEIKKRKWIGIELGSTEGIIERFQHIKEESDYLSSFRSDYNKLFSEDNKRERTKRKLWTDDTFKKQTSNENLLF